MDQPRRYGDGTYQAPKPVSAAPSSIATNVVNPRNPMRNVPDVVGRSSSSHAYWHNYSFFFVYALNPCP